MEQKKNCAAGRPEEGTAPAAGEPLRETAQEAGAPARETAQEAGAPARETSQKAGARPGGLPGRLGARFYNSSEIDWEHLLYTKRDLRALLIPLILEQILTAFMGMSDSVMVTRVGSSAISAVSLADSINVLIIQVFAALAAGGTIVCSQYIGKREPDRANAAAEQITGCVTVISVLAALFCFFLRGPLLRLVFGTVEQEVMEDAMVYFAFTSLSFPFIALYEAGAAFYRAGGNSRFPMIVSTISNVMNISGNALFIFCFHWGVAGAALSTLLSRIFCAAVVLFFLRFPRQVIVLRRYLVRPDWTMIFRVLSIGIPAGIENGMFQFGKLAVQSSVSTLTTQEMAAQAMTAILENLNGIAGIGIGIGLMTVVGSSIGAGRKEEAKYYIVQHAAISEVCVLASCLLVMLLTRPILLLSGMETESAALCMRLMEIITVVKPLIWVPAFTVAYGLRAAGDVAYCMASSTASMWFCRVLLTTILIRRFHFGPIAVWIGMFTDWLVRGILFTRRFLSGKWLRHRVI